MSRPARLVVLLSGTGSNLQALLDARNPYSILTKGTLILRDLDLLLASAEVTDVGLSVSVGCADGASSTSVSGTILVGATVTEIGLPCPLIIVMTTEAGPGNC